MEDLNYFFLYGKKTKPGSNKLMKRFFAILSSLKYVAVSMVLMLFSVSQSYGLDVKLGWQRTNTSSVGYRIFYEVEPQPPEPPDTGNAITFIRCEVLQDDTIIDVLDDYALKAVSVIEILPREIDPIYKATDIDIQVLLGNLEDRKTYYFWVTAFDGDGNYSDPSNMVCYNDSFACLTGITKFDESSKVKFPDDDCDLYEGSRPFHNVRVMAQDKIIIHGRGFGDPQDDSPTYPDGLVNIGVNTFDKSSLKIKRWCDEEIELMIPKYCKRFENRKLIKRNIWLTVDSVETRKIQIEIEKRPFSCQ